MQTLRSQEIVIEQLNQSAEKRIIDILEECSESWEPLFAKMNETFYKGQEKQINEKEEDAYILLKIFTRLFSQYIIPNPYLLNTKHRNQVQILKQNNSTAIQDVELLKDRIKQKTPSTSQNFSPSTTSTSTPIISPSESNSTNLPSSYHYHYPSPQEPPQHSVPSSSTHNNDITTTTTTTTTVSTKTWSFS
eukprot:gb/GECH01000968.1/.p1 GENE.gb/GECH01000968.1/~~gb/GECH01000968.1/.p1  ORF type:complete len:191 (+),score=60.97 gb/GECH01000968.1/:1-573(+)